MNQGKLEVVKQEMTRVNINILEISELEIRDTKGIFHAKMGTKKDRNGMDLTEAEDIKRYFSRNPFVLHYL